MYKTVRGGAARVLAVGISIADPGASIETALAADGRLIFIERDPARAEEARRHFAACGLGERAVVIGADPLRMVYKLAGPFDLIVCGAAYGSLRPMLEKLLAPDGVLVAGTHDE